MKMENASLWLRLKSESSIGDSSRAKRPYVVFWVTCLLMLLLTVGPTLAEDSPKNEAKQSDANAQEEERETGVLELSVGDNWIFSPVILPIVSPDKGAGLALGGMATFSTEPENKELPRSTMVLAVIPSSNSALGIAANIESFWLDDRLRSGIEADFDTGPSNYWPVGYEAGREIDKDEDVTEYDRDVVDIPLVAGWRLSPSIFGGIKFHVLDMKVNERSPTQEEDPNFQEYGDDITNIGAGVRFLYDTRDDTLNAYAGRFLGFDVTFYREWLGSDQEFEVYSVDYRQYHQIKRPGRTIAWQLYGRVANGEVPWVSKSSVGSSNDLRGYTYGRFRDDAAVWALVEYRHMTNTKLWKIGRNGFAAWGGIGFIGEDLGDLGGHELPNAGVGYRLELQDRRNLRLDVGVGYDEVGVYLNFA
ncbi:MAG: BamA/TamA family outer membrane protein, partial [Desulfocapsaceae bacterium]